MAAMTAKIYELRDVDTSTCYQFPVTLTYLVEGSLGQGTGQTNKTNTKQNYLEEDIEKPNKKVK